MYLSEYSILIYIASLFILFKVIELAVVRGINKSNIGIALKKKYGLNEDNSSILNELEKEINNFDNEKK